MDSPALYVLIWIVCGGITLALAQTRGATNLIAWFLVGLLFGPIGVILAIIGAKPPEGQTRVCPQCAEQVQAAAKVCRYCGAALEPIPARSPGAEGTCGRCGKRLSPYWTKCNHCGAQFSEFPPIESAVH